MSLNFFTEDDTFDEERIVSVFSAFGLDDTTDLRNGLSRCTWLYNGKHDFTCENAYRLGKCITKKT